MLKVLLLDLKGVTNNRFWKK